MKIQKFIINQNEKSLTINLVNGKAACLSFEFLRVFSPTVQAQQKQPNIVSHKKLVKLLAIEHVGKHGYRLIFDDQHSAIYPAEFLIVLIKEQKQRWQQYLADLQASGHSREAMINITQL